MKSVAKYVIRSMSLSDQAEVGILISEATVIKDLRTWFSLLWSAMVRNDV